MAVMIITPTVASTKRVIQTCFMTFSLIEAPPSNRI